jgi:L-galactose dehydrogenase
VSLTILVNDKVIAFARGVNGDAKAKGGPSERDRNFGRYSVHYRKLGNTGLIVSIIGFGSSPLGDVYGAITREDAMALVHEAIESGINIFDVAPYYGDTLAETRLGEALQGRRGEILIATKCGRYGYDQFDFSAKTVTQKFDESLRRLRTDYVDLLQIHDVEFGSSEQLINETIPALLEIQRKGKARFIGITGYWPGFLRRIASLTSVDTVLNYCHFNLLINDMNKTLTPFATASGIGLMNASPLHMGLLCDAEVPPWHPAPPAVRAVASAVVKLCRDSKIEPVTLALRFCLDHPSVASTIVGSRSVFELKTSLAALEVEIPTELISRVDTCTKPVFNTVWSSGLNENQF